MDLESIAGLQDGLADALIDSRAWAPLLDSISQAANARGVATLALTGRTPGAPASSSLDELVSAYFETGWSERDGRQRGLPALLRHGSVVDQDYTSDTEMDRDPYWQDFLRPLGFRWFCGVLVRAGEDAWCLAFQRSPQQGPFGPAEQSALARFSAPFSRAATLQRHLGQAWLDGMADALDLMERPGFVLDRRGLLVRCNAAAEALLGDALTVTRGRLGARGRPDVSLALAGHIDAVLWERTLVTSAALSGVAVPRSGRKPLYVQAHRLRGRLANAFSPGHAIALVTDPDGPVLPSMAALRALFQLTPVEARLAQTLTATGNLPDACARIGVSHETGRSYLKVIFTKTGCRSQAELAVLSGRLVNL